MSAKILCVDDEPNVLAAYQRQLRKQFTIDIALGGEEALATLTARGPYAVVVSDMRMPGMNGAEFLARARQTAPDSVRMLLTGYAEQESAIAAVNEGYIFRFLTKPCPPEAFARALTAGLEQYRLITAEKELLEKTLHGSIKALTEVLALVNPLAFGRADRVRRLVGELAQELQLAEAWQFEMAAMLSQIGCVTIPELILKKLYKGENVSVEERRMFEAHPQIGRDLLSKIPRLEAVAEMIAYQEKRFDGEGFPADARKGQELPAGANLLKVALDFDRLEVLEPSRTIALERLKARSGWYDPLVLAALEKRITQETGFCSQALPVRELTSHMVVGEDVVGTNGILLLSRGQEITQTLLQRLCNLAANGAVREPILVLVPSRKA